MTLLMMTRLLAAAVAVLLLLVHRVTTHDAELIIAVLAYTASSLGVLRAVPRLQLSPAAWLADGALALVAASGDWRSPFYVLIQQPMARRLPSGLPARHPRSKGER